MRTSCPSCSAIRIFSPFSIDELLGAVIDQHGDAFGAETLRYQFGNLWIFADHQARRHFHLRHLRAEAGESLGQFAANRTAAQHDQALAAIRADSQTLSEVR